MADTSANSQSVNDIPHSPQGTQLVLNGMSYLGAVKKCPKCNVVLPKTREYFYSRGFGRLASRCKPCGREDSKQYKNRYPERERARQKKYRSAHEVYLREYQKQYYASKGREYFLNYEREFMKKFPDRRFNKDLRKRYGITIAEYNELLKKQDFKCAICGNPPTERNKNRLGVDHCHITGKIRGLLCQRCNTGIGMFRDHPELLAKAIDYLKDDK